MFIHLLWISAVCLHLFFFTADPGPYECSAPNDVIPFPGDCHKYFMCLANANGGYDLQEFTCGDWVFDPHIDACTDPALPSNDNLCNE